ncbi:hypothetical protein MAR_013495 [Mya arenaria]|uniref:Uncharacterized protein n=1 Tax=Mya arenaria TaxID=6604 RepID=A0ABY7G974_MYAAR|nr:hypothetical protein MAR_013495 [Mya arenaria]
MVGNEAKTVKETVEAGKEGNKTPVRDGGLQTSGTLEDSAGLQKYSTQKGNEWKDSENTKKDMVKTVKSGYDLEKNDGIAMDRDLKIELENELARLAEEDDEDFSDGIEDDGIHINVNNEDLLPSTGENSDGIAKDKMVGTNTYVKGHGDRKGDTRSEEESQVRKDYGLRQDIHTKDYTKLQKGSPIVSRMSPKYYLKDNRMKEKDKSKEDLTKHQIIPKYGGARQQGSPTDVATRLESSHLKRPHISEVRSNIDVKSRKSRFQSGASTCTFPARDANSPQRGKITRTNSRDPYSSPRGLSRGTDSRNIPHATKSADEIHTSRLVQDIDSSARDEPYGQYRSSFSPQERPVLSKQYKSSPKAVEQISRDPSPRSRSFLTEPGCDNMSTDRQNEATGWTVHASRHTYVPGHPDVNRMRGNHQDVEPMALQPVIVPQIVSNTPVVYSQYELDGHTVQPALYPDYDKFREDCGTFDDGRYSSPHHETASTDRLLDVHRDYGFSNGARNFSPRDYDDEDIPGRYPDGDGRIHHGYQDAGGDMSSRYHDSDMDISSRNPEEDVGPGYHNSDMDISPSYPDEDIGPGFLDSDMDISTRYSDENRSPKQHQHNDDIAPRYRDNNDIAGTYPHDDISSRFNDHRSSQFSSTDDSYFPASKRQNINTDDIATNNASRAFSEGYKEGVDANSELSVETQSRPLPNAYRHGKILFPAAVTGKIEMMLESSINKEPLQNVVDRWCKTYPHHCPIGLQMVTEFTHHDCELPPVYMCRACDKRLRTNDRYYTMKNMFKHILSEDHSVTFMLSHYKNDYYGLERNAKNADSYFGLFKNLCNRIYKETSKDNSVYEVKTKAVIYWKKAFGMRVSYIKQKIAEQKRLSKPDVKQTGSKKNQPPTNPQSIEQQTMEQQTTEKPTLSISQGIVNRRKKLRAQEVKLVNVESPESFDVKFVEALTKERLCEMIHVFYKRQNKPNPNARGNWKKSERCVVYLLDYDTEIICSYKELRDVEPVYQMRWENLDICTCKGPAEDGRQPVELLMEDIRDGRLSYHALSDILVKMKVARFTGGDGTINPSPIKGIVPHTPKANINTLPKGDNLSTEDQPDLSGNKILSKGDQPSLSGNTNMPKGDNLSKGDQPSLSGNKMLKGDNLSKGNQPGLSGNKNLPKFGNRVKQKGPGLQEEPKVTSTAKDPPPVGKQSEKVMYDIMDQCYNTDGKVAVTTRLNPDSGTVGKSERESTNRKKAVNEVPVCRNDKQEARKSSASKNASSTDISHVSNTGCPSTKNDSCVVSVKTGSVQERDVSISHPVIVKTEPLDVEDATMEPIAIERVKIEPVAFGSIKTEPVTITNVRTESIAIEKIKTEPVAIESSEVDNEELSEGEQEDLENAFKEYMDELEGTADDVSDEC